MKNLEIERKFLVDHDHWSSLPKSEGSLCVQGYLSMDNQKIIRIRLIENRGILTIKGKSDNYSRDEYEYEIPFQEARELLDKFTKNPIEKHRYTIQSEHHIWEVDVFAGENRGLIIAEIELTRPDEQFTIPHWIAKEVTSDSRYYNAYLSEHPFTKW